MSCHFRLAFAHFALWGVLSAGVPAGAQPFETTQAELLERARTQAIRYSASLPDFLCTEIVNRSEDPSGTGRWRSIDKLTVKLSYFDHKEDYKLLQINGRPTTLEYLSAGGALSTGEFGTRLRSIFDPRTAAEFRWKGWTTVRRRRAARFSYRIPANRSTFLIQFGPIPTGPNAIIVAYHGEVLVDEETHMTLRLTQVAEVPEGFPITANESIVDYDFSTVGGRDYLLPSHAYVRTHSGRFVAENNVAFGEYRKFQTDTNITFAPPEK